MKWNHLPVAGGIYDQHPQLLEEWEYLFAAKAEQESKEHAKQEAESKNKKR